MVMAHRVHFCQIPVCCTAVYTGMIREDFFRVEVLAGNGHDQLIEV
jgi:hypothetical protein